MLIPAIEKIHNFSRMFRCVNQLKNPYLDSDNVARGVTAPNFSDFSYAIDIYSFIFIMYTNF